MDNLNSRNQVERFLLGLRLRVPEADVRKIVVALQSGASKYSLYKSGIEKKTGKPRMPIGGKATIDKIKKLIDQGKFEPYLDYLSRIPNDSGETKPEQPTVQGLNRNEIQVLTEYRLKLASGVSEYDVPFEIRPVFQELCIKGIVQIERRRWSSGPRSNDEGYWVYTEKGKEISRGLPVK